MDQRTEGARIIQRTGRIQRDITLSEFQYDMEKFKALDLRVHLWQGKDAQGQPLSVAWVAGPQTGRLFSWYEITGGE